MCSEVKAANAPAASRLDEQEGMVLGTFVIVLREGIEASMIVAILLAYLSRIGRRDRFRDVYAGVGAALLLSFGGGAVVYWTIRDYAGSSLQTIFETGTYLLAAALLTYMTFWMQAHARTLSADLQGRLSTAIGAGSSVALFLLAFQAVGREGLETAVFTLAIAFTASPFFLLLGAVLGLAAAFAIARGLYVCGRRLNMRRFFQVVGTLLMVFAAGLLGDAVQNLQELGWLPWLTHPVWNTAGLLSEDSPLGDVLHSFVGYAQEPTVLQLLVYVTYVMIALALFLKPRTGHSRREPGEVQQTA
jgi:high-affinity iron transporter